MVEKMLGNKRKIGKCEQETNLCLRVASRQDNKLDGTPSQVLLHNQLGAQVRVLLQSHSQAKGTGR